ncbi:Protocadherin alpha-6 [Chelonia mydas]|uniref:Protocadherin alpha-6 n=1 Tax=Chelonia mydas TaxID=8469 RepID=M7BI57_CHEMY|nr:Protocadherin alpha-6 [Chelonia mydas]
MALLRRDSLVTGQLLRLVLLHTAWEVGSGQVRYSLPEESKHGTFVGRLAQDLGLEVSELVSRMFRMVSKGRGDYFEVNLQSGVLFVNSPVDREEVCGQSPLCAIDLEVIVDKPVRIFHVEVEIQDINDNAPVFPVNELNLFISESTLPGSRFPLEGAFDADIGTNSLLTYKLSSNEFFTLDVQKKNDKSKSADLVLRKALDREEIPLHNLLLTATDRGKPELTGTVQLVITVLDVNDNAPVFGQSVYEVSVTENTTVGELVVKLNATDLDEGINKDIAYSFNILIGPEVKDMFSIDSHTGEIRIKGELDFEGHVVGKVRAVDADSGYNAWLRYEVQEARAAGPFRVGVYSGEISTTRALEESDGPSQRLVILVKDHGEPALSATATVSLSLVESPQAVKWDSRRRVGSERPLVDMNVSLVIAICSVSGLFVLVIVVYVGLRCHPGPEVMCGPGKATVVCSSEVGSWSYSQRQSRNLCVGEGTAKNDLMVFSPNFTNSADNGEEKQQELTPNSSGQVFRRSAAQTERDSLGSILEKEKKQLLFPGSKSHVQEEEKHCMALNSDNAQ